MTRDDVIVVVFGRKIIIWHFLFDMSSVCVRRWLCDFRECCFYHCYWILTFLLEKKKLLRIHHFIKYGSCGFSRVKSVTNDIQFGTRRKILWIWWVIITFFVCMQYIPDLFLCGSSFNHQCTFSMLVCDKQKKLILRVYPLYASKVFHQFYEKSFVSSEFYGILFFFFCTAAVDNCGKKYDRIMWESRFVKFNFNGSFFFLFGICRKNAPGKWIKKDAYHFALIKLGSMEINVYCFRKFFTRSSFNLFFFLPWSDSFQTFRTGDTKRINLKIEFFFLSFMKFQKAKINMCPKFFSSTHLHICTRGCHPFDYWHHENKWQNLLQSFLEWNTSF